MDKMHFSNCMAKVFAAHGKTFPRKEIADAIFFRVDGLPDEFMSWAAAQLEDFDKLPANLGRSLRRELWPEYLDKHPELRVHERQQRCNNCSPDLDGFFWAWNLDGTRYCLKCACNARPEMTHWQSWTPRMAVDAGLTLSEPEAAANRPRSLPSKAQSALGHSEPPRQEHLRERAYADAENW